MQRLLHFVAQDVVYSVIAYRRGVALLIGKKHSRLKYQIVILECMVLMLHLLQGCS